jgi:hypothetical protein
MPKIESPFVRKMIDGRYLVTPEIAEGMEWVFEDESVMAIEKLDGTCVSIVVEDGYISSVWNRKNRILPFSKGNEHIIESILEAMKRGYTDLSDGQWFGEVIGEKVNGNPYKIKGHVWIPFKTFTEEHLRYKAWGKYPKDFDTISAWFRDDIFSLLHRMWNQSKTFPEGVVFVHPDGRMGKLRRDMFSFWFEQGGKAHKNENK